MTPPRLMTLFIVDHFCTPEHIEVRPAHRNTILEAFRMNYEGARQERRNIRLDLLRDPEDENRLSVHEIFEGEAALEEHRQTAHYRRCVEMIEPITIGDRQKRYFTPVPV